MKKGIFVVLLTSILVFGLSGCAAQTTPTRPTGTGEAVSGLSTLNKMAVGTFKLDGTANDLTADQARQMLVLWEAYLQLTDSDTAATQEKEAVISQIQSTLTAEQLAAIEALNLTARDVDAFMQEKGLSAEITDSSSSSSGGMGGGGMPGGGGLPGGGGMPGGGGGMPGGGMPDAGAAGMPGANVTPGADGQMPAGGPGGGGGGGYVSEASTQAIIEALIEMLQQKAA